MMKIKNKDMEVKTRDEGWEQVQNVEMRDKGWK